MLQYYKCQNSTSYICTLDAEKCFDSIDHISLFYKLKPILNINHWVLLHTWYGKLRSTVRWNSCLSPHFAISRGTRQGSLLSPHLFNIFINDLLMELNHSHNGLYYGDFKLNNVTYADDITLVCSTATGLQSLIDICTAYSQRWLFNFNPNKSKCLVAGKNHFQNDPVWYLRHNVALENVESLDILGMSLNNKCDGSRHVLNRISKCRQSYYSLQDTGMAYPGADVTVKTHIWKTICQPVLLYGMECTHLSATSMQQLETSQGNLIKQSLGLCKIARTSHLLHSMGIYNISDMVKKRYTTLYRSLFSLDNSCTMLNVNMLSQFLLSGCLFKGTLLSNIIQLGLSPIDLLMNSSHRKNPTSQPSGLVDSIKSLLFHENFLKPYSDEHFYVHLLTKSF